ncbi:hypothetical protein N7501_011975 [Penicillium viridicatum]|nr:hypothetical protein N7501_011975 [Penicillium viridicatum]
MVTGEHAEIAFAVHKAIDKALERMGLDEAIITKAGGREDPLAAALSGLREVTVSATQRKLHGDIDLWLDPVRGNANVAIAIKANRQRPMISIDKWVWGHLNGTSLNSQHIEVSESETDRVKLSGGPLVISSHLVFLRNPQITRETDVRIDNIWLQKIAEWGWDMQFQ